MLNDEIYCSSSSLESICGFCFMISHSVPEDTEFLQNFINGKYSDKALEHALL